MPAPADYTQNNLSILRHLFLAVLCMKKLYTKEMKSYQTNSAIYVSSPYGTCILCEPMICIFYI